MKTEQLIHLALDLVAAPPRTARSPGMRLLVATVLAAVPVLLVIWFGLYTLHCPEDSLLFVVAWHVPAVALVAAIGAAVAGRVLRW